MAPGNKPLARARGAGFTLIELLVVVTLIAIAAATVSMALRDGNSAQLEREGERLVSLLEMARAEARASAQPVRWRPGADSQGRHFQFLGLPPRSALPGHWLGDPPAVVLEGNRTDILLGPEPLIPAQALRLSLGTRQLRIATDGLAPFSAQAVE